MLEHHYRELRLRGKNNAKRKLVLEFMDEKYDLLAEFIMSDLGQFRNEFEQELDAVLNKAGDDDLSKIIDKWSVYPVLRLTLTGRIF